MNKIRIIDLLNKIANGEEVPKFEVHGEKYYVGQDGYLKDLSGDDIEWYIFGEWLNEEAQILEEVEDKEYEDIEELGTNFTYGDCTDELTTIDWQISVISNKINALIRNQKYILERLDKND